MEIWLGQQSPEALCCDRYVGVNDRLAECLTMQLVYLLDLQPACTAAQRATVAEVLQANPAAVITDVRRWVLPRPGLRSAWSAKVQSLLAACGCEGVVRLEQGRVLRWQMDVAADDAWLQAVEPQLFDRMTELCLRDRPEQGFWRTKVAEKVRFVAIHAGGITALRTYNTEAGLGLSSEECQYLYECFIKAKRDPSDVELMMFAQVNSEHCRHKRFNARWVVDGVAQQKSLFDHIRHTHACHPEPVLLAYHDNAAVLRGLGQRMLQVSPLSRTYAEAVVPTHAVLKVETHNHPTAVAPYPGAATGAGGEIRDEAATGCGSASRAGLCGYAVSDLHLPNLPQPWECKLPQPPHLASALAIMCDAPVGAAHYQNEFGRPCLTGFFRTLSQLDQQEMQQVRVRGFHKPMMVAGGVGVVRDDQWQKRSLPHGACLLVLGGPAMRIGLGGGNASSRELGAHSADLDFAAVQRGYPEMQRRCQEVINQCAALAADNPILSIHDVGAGGLSNALPELVEPAGGGQFSLRAIPNAEPGMSPMAVWCNEAQERYVLAVLPEQLAVLQALADRERCPLAVVGKLTSEAQLQLWEQDHQQHVVDMPMASLFADMPRQTCHAVSKRDAVVNVSVDHLDLAEAVKRVLHCPAVASKAFLIHIADRSVTGLVARDQLVGPWQMPVADVAVVADYCGDLTGVAMAMGERSPLALIDAAAAARMAIGEAITNLVAADVTACQQITLSANWMAACGVEGVDAELYEAVRSVGEDFCPALGVCIPVGKDSLSMQAQWQHQGVGYQVASPTSLVATAYATVPDITKTWTPQLHPDMDSMLLLVDLSADQVAVGGSVLAQVFAMTNAAGVDVPAAAHLRDFVASMAALRASGQVLAYHDRSDGGLLATLAEMAFAGRVGVDILLPEQVAPCLALFHESLGAVIQIKASDHDAVMATFAGFSLDQCVCQIARLNDCDALRVCQHGQCLYTQPRSTLLGWWWATSHAIQSLRDNPACAAQELSHVTKQGDDAGLHVQCAFDYPLQPSTRPVVNAPRVAVLREQGSNGHVEMAAAFRAAGCVAVDVTMTDLAAERMRLDDFQIMAACGGFSFGDVLGAGRGWALSVLRDPRLRSMFQAFFHRPDTLTLGVCNGCQMLSQLSELIPGAAHWPHWQENQSRQFESRLSTLRLLPNQSPWWQGMAGACLPVVSAHAQGYVAAPPGGMSAYQHVVAAFADHSGQITTQYPCNPNGSDAGVAALCSLDGRVTVMMPHPERMLYRWQWSWSPWQDQALLSPWSRLFKNAHDAALSLRHKYAFGVHVA